jgi:putative acetyltransferase
MITIRIILPSDNSVLSSVIKTTLEDFDLARPGTVYTDPTTDELSDVFKKTGSVYFVAEEDGLILGGCGIYPTKGLPNGYAELVKLYLRKEARGKKLGFELMTRCLDWAAQFGYTHVYLETFSELSSAVGLYQGLGFHELSAPMGDSGHHACQIWMLKKLQDTQQTLTRNAEFWKAAWEEGRTGFHQKEFHEKLLQYFPGFHPKKGQNVFVPLCGKTKDIVWLHDQGLLVSGIELHAPAVQEFFDENPDMRGEVSITCGDFFEVKEKNHYDFIYDRAALVALPQGMRKVYAKKILQMLKPGGKYLLISYEYDPSELSGPPFSVTEQEIHELYQSNFSITLKESQRPQSEGGRLAAAGTLKQKVYVLEKTL